MRGGRRGRSALDARVETATSADCSSTGSVLAVGRLIVAGDLLRGVSASEEANSFPSAEFSGPGWGVGGVENPRVTESDDRESTRAPIVDENGRTALKTRGREKEVWRC